MNLLGPRTRFGFTRANVRMNIWLARRVQQQQQHSTVIITTSRDFTQMMECYVRYATRACDVQYKED